MQGNFYGYQHQRFLLLLGWGLLSVITGFALQLNPKSFWKQFGIHALLSVSIHVQTGAVWASAFSYKVSGSFSSMVSSPKKYAPVGKCKPGNAL